MYASFRNLLFQLEPEKAHHVSMGGLKMACALPVISSIVKKSFNGDFPSLGRKIWNLHFKNPVGLAAGFDKNAAYLNELSALGFGFVEIGTVTPKPQAGNPMPRLFRLPADKALINRMGFNNDGVAVVKQRLEQYTNRNMIVGGNIGKNKVTDNEDAWKDYEYCFKALHDCVDYFVVNVSSPNTPGLRALQEKDALQRILGQLLNINHGLINPKPLLLKIAPDLTHEQLDDIINLSLDLPLDGLVATNTTIERTGLSTSESAIQQIGAGGLSGKPVQAKSNEVLSYLHKHLRHKVAIIGSGGIFTGEDTREKLDAGADLVQVWTGFVYEGPAIVNNICKHLINS